MHPAIADRIARVISTKKRSKGMLAAQEVVDRLGLNTASPDHDQVLERVNYWKDKPVSDD